MRERFSPYYQIGNQNSTGTAYPKSPRNMPPLNTSSLVKVVKPNLPSLPWSPSFARNLRDNLGEYPISPPKSDYLPKEVKEGIKNKGKIGKDI